MPITRQYRARPFPSSLPAAIALALLHAAGCRERNGCADDLDTIAACNRVPKRDLCDTEFGRCIAACYAELPCAAYADIDDGIYPPALGRCTGKCEDVFTCDDGDQVSAFWRCDGAKDCLDGSDERGCEYHVCRNDQVVRSDAKCDGYAQCGDGSDEEGCL